MCESIKIGLIEFDKLIKGDFQDESLKDFSFTIPNYQRPYAWKEKQIEILLNDLKEVTRQESAYLLGSLILHQNGKTLEIVDGQQRLVTLALICACLQWLKKEKGDSNQLPNKEFLEGKFLMNQNFQHNQSKRNIQNNYIYIQKWFERNDKDVDDFCKLLLDERGSKVEFVYIITSKLDDAFIFFDSANSKGKKLEDYDLIKAYHLREIVAKGQKNTLSFYAKFFEEMAKDGKYLSFFFEEILTPVRLWLRDGSNLVTKKMKVYDEFCKEIPKSFARTKYSSQKMGILTSFSGGVDFFDFLQKYDKLLKTLKDYCFYQKLEEIGGVGFAYARNLYAMVVMIYLDKFPCGKSDYMMLLLARAVFEIRIQEQAIRQETLREYAKELLPLVYFSSFEEELEYDLLAFIRKKDKKGNIGDHNGGMEKYLALVQGSDDSKYSYSKLNIPLHRVTNKKTKGE